MIMQMSMVTFCEYMILYSSMLLLYVISGNLPVFSEDCMNYFSLYIPLFLSSVGAYGNKLIAKTGSSTDKISVSFCLFPLSLTFPQPFHGFYFFNPRLHPQLYDNKTQHVQLPKLLQNIHFHSYDFKQELGLISLLN